MEKYRYQQDFSVKFCDVDFKDELKLSTALAYMEEVACNSADELGFGYAYCKERDLAFMVSNIRVEFFRGVPLGALVNVRTWPTPPSHVVFGREYQFSDGEGVPYYKRLVKMVSYRFKKGKIDDLQDACRAGLFDL